MHRKLLPAIAGAALISVAAMPADAADIIYDPPVYKYEPPEPVSYGGWYLRGYVGLTNQRYRGLDSDALRLVIEDPARDFRWLDRGTFAPSGIIGGGVGYQLNEWLRGDLTVEYRMPSQFSALDAWIGFDDVTPMVNHYRGRKSELLFLANAYADLGNYYGITPYVGAGIGTSRNTISAFRDVNPNTGDGLTAADYSQWQMAWALHAGIGVDLNDRMTLDVGYSFTHLGNARTGAVTSTNPNDPGVYDPFTFRNLHSHDVKMGLRYRFN
jgi:opacity protein-like surface antigen